MELITPEQLTSYLGVGEESLPETQSARLSALEKLTRATGVNWEEQDQRQVANEAIKCMVYLDFYGIRDGLKNTAFIRQHLIELIKMLQCSEEADPDGIP